MLLKSLHLVTVKMKQRLNTSYFFEVLSVINATLLFSSFFFHKDFTSFFHFIGKGFQTFSFSLMQSSLNLQYTYILVKASLGAFHIVVNFGQKFAAEKFHFADLAGGNFKKFRTKR